MKKSRLLIAMILCMGTFIQAQELIPRLVNGMSRAIFNKNPEAALAILEQVDEINGVSFGGGMGPIDRQHYYYRFARTCWPICNNFHSESVWSAYFTADISDIAVMQSMLASNNAGIRTIALLKLQGAKPEAILPYIPALREIAQHDPLIFIGKVPRTDWNGETPPPPGFAWHKFIAPLRTLALQLLGEKSDSLGEGLYEEGMQRVLDAYSTGSQIEKWSILSALTELDEDTQKSHLPKVLTKVVGLTTNDIVLIQKALDGTMDYSVPQK